MDYPEILVGIAEIAVALAGFTGVVVVFGSRSAGSGSDYRFGGRFWVVVDNNGTHEFRNVTTGITDLDQVEIVEGLADGESVLILPSTHLVETQQELQNWISRRIGGVPGIN